MYFHEPLGIDSFFFPVSVDLSVDMSIYLYVVPVKIHIHRGIKRTQVILKLQNYSSFLF